MRDFTVPTGAAARHSAERRLGGDPAMGIVAADRRHGCFHFSPRNVHVVNYPVLLACRFLVELLLQPSKHCCSIRLCQAGPSSLHHCTGCHTTVVSGSLRVVAADSERVFAREQTAVRSSCPIVNPNFGQDGANSDRRPFVTAAEPLRHNSHSCRQTVADNMCLRNSGTSYH